MHLRYRIYIYLVNSFWMPKILIYWLTYLYVWRDSINICRYQESVFKYGNCTDFDELGDYFIEIGKKIHHQRFIDYGNWIKENKEDFILKNRVLNNKY